MRGRPTSLNGEPATDPALLRTLAAAGLPATDRFRPRSGWVSRGWVGDEYVVRLNTNEHFRDAYSHEARVANLLAGSEVPHARHIAHGDGPDGPSRRRSRWVLVVAVLVGLGFVVWRVVHPPMGTTSPSDGYYDCHTDARPWGHSTRGQDLSVTLRHGRVVDLLRAYARPSRIETKRGSDGFTFSLVELGKYFVRGGAANQRLTFTCGPIDFWRTSERIPDRLRQRGQHR